ncbi:porin family protein [Hymenobacter yonginensis]|uniref:Porin family protein n=1 Tax=Hymenobacter yonginensis TaxID=748197 RepID=A0ABY7PJX4_9BACT|nr:porin family protein [Hymenobacter yonginensis]WBO83585.1 porin family protein [Hymenobacter yonginensis]
MKNLFLSGATFLLSTIFISANAQNVRWGVKVGVNYAGVTSPNYEGPQRRWAPAVGVFAQVPLSSDGFLILQPELLYSQKGSRITYASGTYTDRFHYLDLPILARINAGGLFFEVGPQISYLVAVRNEGPTGTFTNTEGANRLQAGGVAGVGYQLPMGLGLGVRYTHDLVRIARQGPRNSVFQAQLSYLLGSR